MLSVRTLLVSSLVFLACGPVEVRIDALPLIKGSNELTLGTFTCGMPIPADKFEVTTRVVGDGCELSFGDNVELLKASDYGSIPAFSGPSGSTNVVKRIELEIRKLDFTDTAAGVALDINTRVTAASLEANGQSLADKAALTALPHVVSLQADALAPLKAKIDKKEPVSVGVKVVVVIPNSPPPPMKMKIDYEAQPAVVLGPPKLF